MSTIAMAPPLTNGSRKRIESIDLLRGTVMVIMALDHVRDYFHDSAFEYDPTDLSQTNTAVFFTRWITHFCAPVFIFLAGASAHLNGLKKTKKELSFFLFTRGLWLVIAEMLIITLGWTFNPLYPILILQVIWAIGFSMIALSVMIFLPEWLIGLTGIVFIGAHNLLDNTHVPGTGVSSFLWSFVHEQNFYNPGPFGVFVGYPVLPWIGIMLTGYVFGKLYTDRYSAARRKKILVYLGVGAILLFIVLRFINAYGDPSHWSEQKSSLFTFFSFLRTTKYPPSLLYTLMTLGPALLFLAFTEGRLNRFTQKLVVFGRVPMFFYILHIFLIHGLAVIAVTLSGYNWSDMVLNNWVSASPQLKGFGYNLAIVYVLWILITMALYPLCKWYDNYKRQHREKWWLSYV